MPAVLEAAATPCDVAAACRTLAALLQACLAREVVSSLGADRVPTSEDAVDLGPVDDVGDDARLHEALQDAVHRRITQRLDAIFTSLGEALDEIQQANQALHEALSGQVESLRQRTLAARRQ